ncbi:MAG: HEAT repeat domain-containing protein [Anaerolineae bacterium]|nr:HEAT repeat domain-containing protein [Anaerolineae bacterium]
MTAKTTSQNLIQSIFKIRPGEGGTVGLLFVYYFLLISGNVVVSQTVSRALFLSALPRDAIPYRYIGVTFGIVLGGSLYARVATRYRRDRLIIGSTGVMLVGVLLFRALLETPWANSLVILGGMYVYFEVVQVLGIIQFWTLAAEILNSREGKRLFSLIAGGGAMATIIGGAALSVIAGYVAPQNLIFFIALAQVGIMASAARLGRQHRAVLAELLAQSPTSAQPQSDSFAKTMRELKGVPLFGSLSGIIVIMTLVVNVVDYQFDLALQATFAADAGRMSAFLGTYLFWTGIGSAVMQFVVASRVMKRFGLLVALLLVPASFALGSSFILISSGALWAVTMARASGGVFQHSINAAAINLLYLPLLADLRARAKAIVDGIFKPVIIGVGGLLFLVLGHVHGVSVVPWSLLVFALIAGWVVIVLRARRQYTAALAENLQKRCLELDYDALDGADEATVKVLAATLQHHDALQVIHALHLIEAAPQVDWDPHVAPLLAHPAPEVRLTAVRYLGREGNTAYAQPITALFHAPEEEMRAAAILAYTTINGSQAVPLIIPFLLATSPTVKGSAVVGLIKYGGLDGVMHAAEHLKHMLSSEQPAMRAEGARVLGALQTQNFYEPLIALFDDQDIEVQTNAIRAAGDLRSPALAPFLMAKLNQRATSPAAVEALVRYGPGIESQLGEVLACHHQAHDVRRRIPEILERIGTRAAADILLEHLAEPVETVRTSILKALAGLRAAGVNFTMDEEVIQPRLNAEIGHYYWLYVLNEDLGCEGRGELLDETLKVRLDQALDRIFFLLALVYPVREIQAARRSLAAEPIRLRAYAIELIDNLVNRDTRELLIPLFESPTATILDMAQTRFGLERRSMAERLKELAGSADPWLHAIAIHRIGVLGLAELASPVAAALNDSDALVRETALEAKRHIATANLSTPSLEIPAPIYPGRQAGWHAGELLPHLGGLATA